MRFVCWFLGGHAALVRVMYLGAWRCPRCNTPSLTVDGLHGGDGHVSTNRVVRERA